MTKTRELSDFLIEGGADLPLGKPHIVPGVLQPAVAGNDLSGTALGNSYVYGTAHTDGHKYYYTDIKGSKPIKDPRIGAHFGSQRHKFKSIQILEQETATHGKNVYSVDGREWIRAVSGTSDWIMANNDWGNYPKNDSDCAGAIIEIVGYFNDINFIKSTYSDRPNDVDLYVNGTILVDGSTTVGGVTTAASPLGGRYVDASSVINGGSLTANGAGQSGTLASNLGTTPKINTLKFEVKTGSSKYVRPYGIELIAQDTTSTANRSKIQIPAQNVVSFGKKFPISATAVHYDPFTTMSYGGSGTTASALGNLIDTATSLGMDNWKAGGDNFHRPWNGGRVVKWVDSSGTIKTSVTMMPPNAQNISATASNPVSNAEVIAGTNAETINFDTTTIANASQLHEVAKTFHWREFGNGGANGNATYRDASTLDTSERNIAYVMDDGLTSCTGDQVYTSAAYGLNRWGTGSKVYFTFIGTGITWNTSTVGMLHWAQNLPYGTHVVELATDSSEDDQGTYKIDGVTVKSDFVDSGTSQIYRYHSFDDIHFHQPKRPPIPEDACVLADFMLMADFVPVNAQNSNIISKGVRRQNSSRDVFYDETDGDAFSFHTSTQPEGFGVEIDGSGADNATSFQARIPSFGTNIVHRGYASPTRSQIYVGSTSQTTTDDSTSNNYGSYQYITTDKTLGVYNWGTNAVTGTNGNITSYEIVTPIHTSFHYQSFETPFLHELIGGDRNMEQTNLVCSPDGKTWDEVTRDTSYIGNQSISTAPGVQNLFAANAHPRLHTKWRGTEAKSSNWRVKTWLNKDFAIAYNAVICLKDGLYRFTYSFRLNTNVDSAGTWGIILNEAGTENSSVTSHIFWAYQQDANDFHTLTGNHQLKRGDVISWQGPSMDNRGDIVQIDRIS